MIEMASRRVVAISTTVALGLAYPLLGAFPVGSADAQVRTAETTAPAARSSMRTARRLDVQGTIAATVDGRRITWYSVFGESGGRPYSSSSWMELPSGARMVGVGGFSTDEPPLESFEWDPSGMPTSYGTYDGPIIAVAIQLPAEGNSFTVTFPDVSGITALAYQPTASLENVMATTFVASEGTLSVSNVEVSGGLARAEGTFSGTFRAMQGGGSVVMTDGTFDVEGIPSLETIRR